MTVSEFNACVDLYADNLYRFILKNVKDKEMARDIVQDTYEKLWLKVSDIESRNAKSYMFTTAYRTMIDKLRREKRIVGMDESHSDILKTATAPHDLKNILNAALERLPEIQRSVILLRDYEGYSYNEIGKITGLSEAQVKVYIYRARVQLKNYIGTLENVI